MITSSILTCVCGLLLAAIVLSTSSNWKLCCDKDCRGPISHARTTNRNIRREDGYLTYPSNTKVTIFAKNVGNDDIWEGELHGRYGYIRHSDLEETLVHCPTPQHWVPLKQKHDHSDTADNAETDAADSKQIDEDASTDSFEEEEILTETHQQRLHGDGPSPVPFFKEEGIPQILEEDNDNAESTDANTESNDISAESTDANTESNDISAESIDDNAESAESNVESTDANTESTDPNAESTDANTESTDESIDNSNIQSNDHIIDYNTDSNDNNNTGGLDAGSIDVIDSDESNVFNTFTNDDSDDKNDDSDDTNDDSDDTNDDSDDKNDDSDDTNDDSDDTNDDSDDTNDGTNADSDDTNDDSDDTNDDSDDTNDDSDDTNDDSATNNELETEPLIHNVFDSNTTRTDSGTTWTDSGTTWTDSDTIVTDADATRTDSDATRTDSDATRTDSDATRIDSDATRIDSDATRTDFDITRTDFDTTKTDSDATRADSDTTRSVSDANSHTVIPQDDSVNIETTISSYDHISSDSPSQTIINMIVPSFSKSEPDGTSTPSIVQQETTPPTIIHEATPTTQTPLRHLSSIMNDRHRDTTRYQSHGTAHQQAGKWKDIPVVDKEWQKGTDSNNEREPDPINERKYIIDYLSGKLVSVLPASIAEMFASYGPDTGLIVIVTTAIAMILPSCCFCFNARKTAKKTLKLLNAEMSRKKNTDAHITNLNTKGTKLQKDVDTLQNELSTVRKQMEIEQQGNWDLEHARSGLEQDKATLTKRLQTLEQENSQDKANMKRIKEELKKTNDQLLAIINEKAHAESQVKQFNSKLEEAVLKSEELEAAKLQLEEDCYTVRNSLEEMTAEHAKLSEVNESLDNTNKQLQTQIQTITEELTTREEAMIEKDKELEVLKECVVQLEQSNDNNNKVDIVRSLLDTTKVRTELNETCKDRDRLKLELQEQESVLDQLKNENESLQDQVNGLNVASENQRLEFVETEMKLKAITEYFEQKETQLHRKIGAEEIVRQRVEYREAHAKERAEQAEIEREKEREELKELRKQMGDIEKSLMQQVVTNEKRAEESLSQLRRTEQDLRAANKEITALKRRLEDARRSPSPPGPRPPIRPFPPEMRRSPLPPMAQKIPPPGYRSGYGPHGPPGPGILGPPPGPMGPPPPGPMGPPPPGSMGPPLPRSSSPLEDKDKSHRGDRLLPPRPRSVVNEGGVRGYHADDATSRTSRQTPPGMESHDPYRPRPDYPLPPRDRPQHYGDDPRHIRPFSRSSINNSMDDSRDDRPPIPGNHDYPPPPRSYGHREPFYRPLPPPDRPRPPSGPQYGELESRSFERPRDHRDYPPPPSLLNQSGPPIPRPAGPIQSLPPNSIPNQDNSRNSRV